MRKAKVPGKWIRVVQGATTAVFQFRGYDAVIGVRILHRRPKPVLFRKSRRI